MLRLLDVLLKDQVSVEEKKQRLEEEFHIPMEYEMERKINIMCNLSDGIEQRGIERGIEQGKAMGMVQAFRLINLNTEEILEKLMKELEMTKVEAQQYL